jgi:hypothetical protein
MSDGTQARLGHVAASVAAATAELGTDRRHRGFRAALDEFGARLGRIHDRCHEVDEQAWAAYAARLDRGLDELQVELARAAEDADPAPSAEDLLFARTTRLELDGWLSRLDVPGAAADRDKALEMASVVSRELADYRAACSTGSGASRAAVEQAMADLRRVGR